MDVEPKIRGTPPRWMVKIMENPMNKWMIWGYHLFLETPMSTTFSCSTSAIRIFKCWICSRNDRHLCSIYWTGHFTKICGFSVVCQCGTAELGENDGTCVPSISYSMLRSKYVCCRHRQIKELSWLFELCRGWNRTHIGSLFHKPLFNHPVLSQPGFHGSCNNLFLDPHDNYN